MPLGTKASFSAIAAAYHSAAASSSASSPAAASLGGSTPSHAQQREQQQAQQHQQQQQQQQQAHHTLHSAAASGNLAAARSLLKSYASESTILAAALAQPLHGVLPLHAAASGGNEHIVALLLSYGADPNALLYRPLLFVSPIQTRNASVDLPRRGSTTGAPPPVPQPAGPGEDGSTALHFAAAGGHRAVIVALLQHGARADAKDNRGITPEMLASATGHNLCAEILRKAAAGPAIVPVIPANPSSVSGGPSSHMSSSSSSSTMPVPNAPSSSTYKRERALTSIRRAPPPIEIREGAGPPPLTTPTRGLKKQASLEHSSSTTPVPNGPSSSTFKRERALTGTRRPPPPIEIREGTGPPPVTTPTRGLKKQASLEHIAAGMKATFSGWNRSPRMQTLLLQASNGPPPSPNRAQRVGNKRSFPNILRKLGSQSHMSQPSPSLPSTSAAGGGGGGSMPAPATSVSRQRSTEFDSRDRMPPPLLPNQSHMRSRTTTKSRDRLFERVTASHAASTSTPQPGADQSSTNSIDVAHEEEDEEIMETVIRNYDVGVTSREAAQQILNRAEELLLQSPALISKVPMENPKPSSSAETNNEELSLADQLLIFGAALARERELATPGAAAVSASPPTRKSKMRLFRSRDTT